MENGKPSKTFETPTHSIDIDMSQSREAFTYTLLTREHPSSSLSCSLPQRSAISGSVSKCIIVFAVAKPEFLTCTISRFKCFKLMGLHPLCAALFAVGYALREYGAFNYLYNTQNLIIYILSVCLIYICP